ncbi:SUMF1/EgtB/PvdO family nonheme iron enzyme [Brucella sp. IR073]|uniref:SUMF1/EgtB/PvdO family nonheme iron enzyme n=1 Tax=unclassified Brucella TaxID=2632610 RepID=UPI003B98191D
MRAIPISLLALGSAALLGAGVPSGLDKSSTAAPLAPALVRIEPGEFRYRVAGEFTVEGQPVDGPLIRMKIKRPFSIMETQVSEADYAACVADGACQARDGGGSRPDFPAVGVNWQDATAYADWLSRQTGQRWRLPTDEEWWLAAGSRAKDEALGVSANGGFAERWLAKYDQEALRKTTAEKAPRPFGSFGMNENGLLDIAGNVWEWTDSCFTRQALGPEGAPKGELTVNCGVRVVAGEHRSYITDFIRDPRSGGCSVGTPPANLGFRLVRDDDEGSLFSRLLASVRGSRSWHEWPRIE